MRTPSATASRQASTHGRTLQTRYYASAVLAAGRLVCEDTVYSSAGPPVAILLLQAATPWQLWPSLPCQLLIYGLESEISGPLRAHTASSRGATDTWARDCLPFTAEPYRMRSPASHASRATVRVIR